MSYTREQLETVENAQADFDMFLSRKEFESAAALVENLGEEGYEHEAMILHRALNKAEQAYLETPTGDLEYAEGLRPEYPKE